MNLQQSTVAGGGGGRMSLAVGVRQASIAPAAGEAAISLA
mgnify:CR=1 FL=1